MIRDDVLEQGIVRGIVTDRQAADLRALALELTAASAPEPEDDEKLRFVTGFSDVFVTLGIALFTGALAYLVSQVAGSAARWAVLTVTAWLLAEFFTRRRRMALPSIVLLCLFTFSVFKTADLLFAMMEPGERKPGFLDLFGIASKSSGFVTASALITMAMLALHYLRFRVPITIAAGAAALVTALIGSLFAVFPDMSGKALALTVFCAGCAVFALAMRFDLSDPQRVTRRNDIAFWLHLLAAPLIVHPLVAQFTGDGLMPQVGNAVAVLALFVLLGAVAVLIDRRAMLVSGLGYAGFALSSLISQVGLADRTLPATVLVLGAFVLLLSAGWRPVRTALLRLLPTHLAHRLPHPILSS
ncbi:MAG TPA: hypothetical protein VK434_00705 [Microvirga sp.]|nr:hypothetical protein [Microvirga sp.]